MAVLNTEAKTTYPSFHLAEETSALEVGRVREVLDVMEMTRIPNMPGDMRGVIDLRGSVVPVADMRLKLGMEAAGLTADTCIVVTEMPLCGQVAEAGVPVDSVQEICEICGEDIAPPPNIGMNMDSRFI